MSQAAPVAVEVVVDFGPWSLLPGPKVSLLCFAVLDFSATSLWASEGIIAPPVMKVLSRS